MKVEEKGHTIVLKDTKANAVTFLEKLTEVYASYKDKNIIIDLSHEDGLVLDNLLPILSLSNEHRAAKKSFVLVVKGFDFDDDENPEELIIVPTIQEAHDIIEMEEIERDLGF